MTLILRPEPFTLASASKVRSSLLSAAGISHKCVAAAVSERELEYELEALSPAALASALARAKASNVAKRVTGLVLGADQTLALDNELLHKPANLSEARAQLMKMRGKSHTLNSAICLMKDGKPVFEHVSTAQVHVRAFSESFLETYLEQAGDAVLTSVGCYQIEGLGVQLFEKIEGDQFTIMGLPLLPLLAYLRRSGNLAE